MNNIQDFIVTTKMFRTFKVDDLLFAEFKCPVEASTTSVWCDNNFFAFILTGETLIRTPRNDYPLKPGDCVFVKKGSILIESEYQDDFCELMVFVSDDFIRSVILKYKIPVSTNPTYPESDKLFPFSADDVLKTYFHSLLSYFNEPVHPPGALLRLKFEELIVNILSNAKYQPLKRYFSEVSKSSRPSIQEIMEENFTDNLSLAEFARLCARSLSGFKTEFKRIHRTTPGKWLQEKRLNYSRYLMQTTGNSIDEIYLKSGFENKSHFTRVFKNKFGCTPGKYKTHTPK